MSLRSITRAPAKRMLVFFEADQKTSIVPTSKVKKILGEGNTLKEGVDVVVKYDKVDYKAHIIKLHDDPTVLSECERNYLECEFNESNADEAEADKENKPAPKRVKLVPSEKRADKGKQKIVEKKKEKPKKIIVIEAEGQPAHPELPIPAETVPTPKPANQPGSLNFLCLEEQQKVKKILELYQGTETADASTQTEVELSIVQTLQVHTAELKCSCQDKVLAKLEEIKEMLSCSTTTPLTSTFAKHQPDNLFNNDPIVNFSNESSEEDLMFDLLPGAISASNQAYKSNLARDDIERPVLLPRTLYSSVSPQNKLFDEVFKRSASMGNYAKNLVFDLFKQEELIGANCAGVKGKRGLEQDSRMATIKESVFKKYSVENKVKSWSLCRKAIDSAIRKLKS